MRGRLEIVHIEDILPDRGAFGRFHGGSILVENAADYAGMECIVKFSLWPKLGEEEITCNFITSNVQSNFQGLARDKYILVGVWEPWMEKKSDIPYLEEISRYYDPGDVGEVYFFRDNKPNKSGGLAVVDGLGRIGIHETVSALVMDYLTDYDVYSRVVVAEPLKVVNVLQRICEFGLIPVLMQPLNSK